MMDIILEPSKPVVGSLVANKKPKKVRGYREGADREFGSQEDIESIRNEKVESPSSAQEGGGGGVSFVFLYKQSNHPISYVNPDTNPIDAQMFLKSVNGIKLESSYLYLSEKRRSFCEEKLDLPHIDLPIWIDQHFVSKMLFGTDALVTETERHHGRYFVWAPEFSNVHDTFDEPDLPITIYSESSGEEVLYKSVEHWYQEQKFVGTPDHKKAREQFIQDDCDSTKPWKIGNRFKIREDWNSVKVDVMSVGQQAKYGQHPELKKLLLSTGEQSLVQLKAGDEFWGSGKTGEGANRLGGILNEVRAVYGMLNI